MYILFIGHSLIEFYDWQKRFPEHKVLNLGVAGETVEGLFSRLDRITKEHASVDLIFIMTGLNNVAMEDFGFFDSYKKIVKRLTSTYPAARIFINSLLPTLLEFMENETIQAVNSSLRELAGDADVEFLDIYDLFVDENGRTVRDLFVEDGVHLSNKGYAVWSKVLAGIIYKSHSKQ